MGATRPNRFFIADEESQLYVEEPHSQTLQLCLMHYLCVRKLLGTVLVDIVGNGQVFRQLNRFIKSSQSRHLANGGAQFTLKKPG
jgi:hypothetical protein